MEAAIATRALAKHYRDVPALAGLDLDVPAGCVFGYLGPNGAGKTTTIRLLLGLIRPTGGSATVLGFDTVTERHEVHRRVGYLPGEFAAYRELTGAQYLEYLAELRGGVDRAAIDELAERFDLDLRPRIKNLSHGNRQKVGIVQACMHRPDLLILDEPTQGLDPLMQQEFLDLLREHRDHGRTVFLSSHVLAEVEEIADAVAIIRAGRLVMVSTVDELKARARRPVEIAFAEPSAAPLDALRAVGNVVEVGEVGDRVRVVVEGSMAELLRVAAPYGIERVISEELDLEGVFLQYYQEV